MKPSYHQSRLFLMNYLFPAKHLMDLTNSLKISQQAKRSYNWHSQFLTEQSLALDRHTQTDRHIKTGSNPFPLLLQKQKAEGSNESKAVTRHCSGGIWVCLQGMVTEASVFYLRCPGWRLHSDCVNQVPRDVFAMIKYHIHFYH